MNRFFLVVRVIVLVALLFLLAAVFWGLANRESTEASNGTVDLYERYQRSKPAGYTSVLLIVMVVLGIVIVVVSIVYEYHLVRKGVPRESSPRREREERDQTWK